MMLVFNGLPFITGPSFSTFELTRNHMESRILISEKVSTRRRQGIALIRQGV
jgi:hypothetical protein